MVHDIAADFQKLLLGLSRQTQTQLASSADEVPPVLAAQVQALISSSKSTQSLIEKMLCYQFAPGDEFMGDEADVPEENSPEYSTDLAGTN